MQSLPASIAQPLAGKGTSLWLPDIGFGRQRSPALVGTCKQINLSPLAHCHPRVPAKYHSPNQLTINVLPGLAY